MKKEVQILNKTYKASDLIDHPSFCVLPWIHFHAWPQGNVLPCCIANPNNPISNYTGQAMGDLMNEEKYKKMRLDMLNGKQPNEYCNYCFKQEKTSPDWESPRISHNKEFLRDGIFGPQLTSVLESTKEDGEIDFRMMFVDIRFSNVCNLKCRTCFSGLSSAIAAEEYAALGGDETKLEFKFKNNGIINLTNISSKVLEEILVPTNIDNIQKAYFAGGEPLFTPEHFAILEGLLDRGNIPGVRLLYNTNFTRLNYKGKSILDVWKLFPLLNVGTSVDDIGNRLGYLRNGAKWEVIAQNFKSFFEVIPEPEKKIYNSITISVFNIFYLDEIIEEFIKNVGVKKLTTPIVFGPEMMCITTLPEKAKVEITRKLELYSSNLPEEYVDIKNQIKHVLALMNEKDTSHLLKDLAAKIQHHDILRGENFVEIYPELEKLTGISSFFSVD